MNAESRRATSYTEAKAAHTRADSVAFILANATRIASVVGRLKEHARRCGVEKGYYTHDGANRQVARMAISGMAHRLEDRARLHLTVPWWLEQAQALLDRLDKLNGKRRDT